MKLKIIVASTRPGRKGPAVGKWIERFAREQGKFEVEGVDLADLDLPIYNEAAHPATKVYEHAHTLQWSQIAGEADAFVFVTPEYDFGMPPSLLNALVYLYHEWNYKPAAFVSYGGLSGGLRAVQDAKLTLTAVKMVPLVEAVTIPFINQHLDDAGVFKPNENHLHSATSMLNELHRWAEALKPMRG